MSSVSLMDWSGVRRRRLTHFWNLEGRAALPLQQTQIHKALIVQLATEFQGFARDLHNEGIRFFANKVSQGNAQIESAVVVGLAANRFIDRGNPRKDAIGKDFNRLGFIFWRAIDVAYAATSATWKQDLDKLIDMRNALAHDDVAQQVRLGNNGYTVGKTQVQTWQQGLDGLTVAMDDVVGSSLATLLGTARPW